MSLHLFRTLDPGKYGFWQGFLKGFGAVLGDWLTNEGLQLEVFYGYAVFFD
jgi:hypothetical protein